MSEFNEIPSTTSVVTGTGTKISTGVPIFTTASSSRSTSSAGPGSRIDSVPATFTYFSPQPIRRYSNPIGSSSSGFYSNSPNESRTQSFELKSRRYSQPSSSSPSTSAVTTHPLVKQEKESYSSLSFLPEVQTYLQFMEDSNVPPHRSNSFGGRNSSRRSSCDRKLRRRSHSQTPNISPGEEWEEQETSFTQSKPSTSYIHHIEQPRPYGQYLTPMTSRSVSLDTQVHPPSRQLALSSQLSLGNDTSAVRGHRRSSLYTPQLLPHQSPMDTPRDPGTSTGALTNEQQLPIFQRCFEQRRRSSTIRTSFI